MYVHIYNIFYALIYIISKYIPFSLCTLCSARIYVQRGTLRGRVPQSRPSPSDLHSQHKAESIKHKTLSIEHEILHIIFSIKHRA